MPNVEAVVFDLYGTLIELRTDSKPYRVLADKVVERGRLLQHALVSNAVDLKAWAAEIDVPHEAIDALQHAVEADIATAYVFDDVERNLEKLRSNGVKLGVLSNVAAPYKKAFFNLGLDRYFSAAIFSSDIGFKKPDARAFKAVLTALNVEPSKTLMVGDGVISDIRGASAVGMKALLIDRKNKCSEADAVGSIEHLFENLQNY